MKQVDSQRTTLLPGTAASGIHSVRGQTVPFTRLSSGTTFSLPGGLSPTREVNHAAVSPHGTGIPGAL